MLRRTAGTLLLVLGLQGCSFVFARGPSSSGPAKCTQARGLPIADAAIAAGLTAMALFATSWPVVDNCDELECYDSKKEKATEIAVLSSAALVESVSAWYGFRTVSRCREAVRDEGAGGTFPDPALGSRFPSGPPSSVPRARRSEATTTPPTGEGAPSATHSDSAPKLVGTGTCFAVSKKGHIVTNSHVVADARRLEVYFGNEPGRVATVQSRDADKDVALLKIERPTKSFLGLVSSRSVALGDQVFTLGYPEIGVLGLQPKYTDGTISSTRTKVAWQMQISVPLQPGNSGGPLVNAQGLVVGITTARFRGMENANIAVKSDYIIPMLNSPVSPRPLTTRREAIELAEASVCLVAVYE